MPAVTQFSAVIVSWVDSNIQDGQHGLSDLPQVAEMVTCGLLIAQSGQSITIARESVTTGTDATDVRGVITIPMACVQAVCALAILPHTEPEEAPPLAAGGRVVVQDQ